MRIIKYIPNTITSMNLLSGTLGVIFTLEGRIDIAFPLMLAAACFDFCDGLAARLLGAYSDIGKELDSLADMVSFGVLPSLMLYSLMGTDHWTRFIPLCIAVFSGLRLAKFNIDDRQHSSFVGLPTPAAAMICGSMAYCVAAVHSGAVPVLDALCGSCWFIPVVSVVLSALLVCELPMFAMKFGKGLTADKMLKIKRLIFLLSFIPIVISVIILKANWALVILLAFVIYILINVISSLFCMRAE